MIGAGIAGIALAKRLLARKKDFLVLEKSKSSGGRLATRRDQNTKFDHGAQFLKNEAQAFELSNDWLKQGLLKTWFEKKDVKYQCCASGMNWLVKKTAEEFLEKIFLGHHLLKLQQKSNEDGFYLAEIKEGLPIKAKQVYLTCPLPQSLKILSDSFITYPEEMNQINYAKALVGLYVLKKDDLPSADLLALETFKFQDAISDDIFSIANQGSKGLSAELAFTIVMSPTWSEKYFDADESSTLKQMSALFLSAVQSVTKAKIGKDPIERNQLKKWRYSHPLQRFPELHKIIQPGLILSGDAFGGASINGTLRSAESIDLDLY